MLVEQLAHEAVDVDDPPDLARHVPSDPDDDYLPALALSRSIVTRDIHFDAVEISGLRIVTAGVRMLRGMDPLSSGSAPCGRGQGRC